jgi:hypothetical protein
MKTPVALLLGVLLTACNTVDLSELPAQEELRVGPTTPAPQKGGVPDDGVKPVIKPTVIQKGGVADDGVKPVQRGGVADDGVKPVPGRITPPPTQRR